MTTIRDFINHPVLAIDPRSIPASKPIGRNLTCGARDFPARGTVIPPPSAFFKTPDLKGLPPLSALYSRPRSWLTQG